MKFAMAIAMLLAASSVHAQENPEAGLVQGHLITGEPVKAEVLRPQLVHHDHQTPVIVGGVAAVTGGIALVASWSLYIARQNYRLRYWTNLDKDTIGNWENMGAWTLWMGGFGAASLVASEYLLLPESRDVPWWSWLAGGVGLGVAAVGVGFAVAGEKCAPVAIKPGTDLRLACSAGTADGIFGWELMLTAMPLINFPLTYLFHRLFAGAPESLSIGPMSVSGRF